MAENENKKSAAQSELGELYVDIGSKGLGSMLKGMTGLSAKFLLARNSAVQFAQVVQKPFQEYIKASKNAGRTVTNWEKMNAVMNLSIKDIQDIEIFSKLNNVDFNSYMSQIKNVQDKLMDIRTGKSNDVQGLSMLGLTAYDFDPNKPLDFLEKVRQKVKQVDKVTATAALRWLGLDDQLLFVWGRENKNFDERLKLSKDEIELVEAQQRSWNSLSTTWQAFQNKVVGGSEVLVVALNGIQKWIEGVHPYLNNLGDALYYLFAATPEERHEYKRTLGQQLYDMQEQAANNGINPLNQNDLQNVLNDPEKRRKYLDAQKKQKENYKQLEKSFKNGQKQAQIEYDANTPVKTMEELREMRLQNRHNIAQNNANLGNNTTPMDSIQPQQSVNNFGVFGSQLLSPTPIDDFSAPTSVGDSLNAVPQHLQNNVNNISFEINQTITGDNPQQIAAASASAIDEASLNILQAQNQWAV